MLRKRIERRQALKTLGGAGIGIAFGCGGNSATGPSTAASASTPAGATVSTNATCAVTPTETVGPYPSLVDLFRSDIRESKTGTVLSLTIRVVNANSNCAPVSGAAVEIWQCDALGNYSSYGSQTGQTYLRGIQTTNASGEVVFTTIYPGWYQGRATHIHAEVTVGGRSVKVTQIAFPESINNAVHATGVYASRGSNPTTNLQDGIFADSLSAELVTPTGSPQAGYSAAFQIGIAA
ncbi:MAG: intradiol ring-cleavage dioxygenase [Vicinamibacteria bacterium]|nr:intradiol ring-cleavage dioxygenase [Vicinamibacteria bacterium]